MNLHDRLERVVLSQVVNILMECNDVFLQPLNYNSIAIFGKEYSYNRRTLSGTSRAVNM